MVAMLLEGVFERDSLVGIEWAVEQEVFHTFYVCPTWT